MQKGDNTIALHIQAKSRHRNIFYKKRYPTQLSFLTLSFLRISHVDRHFSFFFPFSFFFFISFPLNASRNLLSNSLQGMSRIFWNISHVSRNFIVNLLQPPRNIYGLNTRVHKYTQYTCVQLCVALVQSHHPWICKAFVFTAKLTEVKLARARKQHKFNIRSLAELCDNLLN